PVALPDVQYRAFVAAEQQVVPPVVVDVDRLHARGTVLPRDPEVHLAEVRPTDVHVRPVGRRVTVGTGLVVADEQVGVPVVVQVDPIGVPAAAPDVLDPPPVRLVVPFARRPLDPQLVPLLGRALLRAFG